MTLDLGGYVASLLIGQGERNVILSHGNPLAWEPCQTGDGGRVDNSFCSQARERAKENESH